jgi:hypothetical protein
MVISTSVNVQGTPGNESHVIHEQRFGVKNQIEVDVPIQFEDQNHVWYGGIGDATLAMKRVMFSNLDRGSILSLQGGFLIPTGNKARGFGSGTTTFETFAAFDQVFRDTFIKRNSDWLPFHTNIAPQSLFQHHYRSKLCGSPAWATLVTMMEFVATRDLVTGGKTDWDLIPQMQVTISRRQHVRGVWGFAFLDQCNREAKRSSFICCGTGDGKLTEGL